MSQLLEQAIHASLTAGKAILEVYTTDFRVDIKNDNTPLTQADMRAHDIIMHCLKQTDLPIISEEGSDIPHFRRESWERFWLVDPLDGTKEFVKRNDEFSVNIALVHFNKPILGVVYMPVEDVLYFAEGNQAFRLDRAGERIVDSDNSETIVSKARKMPLQRNNDVFTIVTSRSHVNKPTNDFISEIKQNYNEVRIISHGSSLKLCLVAEGVADVYPRFGTTYEWDIAAGHAIISAAGGKVVVADNPAFELHYNKDSLLNPSIIAYHQY
jgi:3'(2'), 5'-bisphosphate nucleotidase